MDVTVNQGGGAAPQGQSFDDILSRARIALPRVNPHQESQETLTPELELKKLASEAIGKVWSLFQSIAANSDSTPSLGTFYSPTMRFERTAESFQDEFQRWGDPSSVAERLQHYMQQAFGSVLDRWIAMHTIPMRDSSYDSAKMAKQDYRRIEQLLREGHARQADNVRTYLLAGFDTSLGSILSSVQIMPALFNDSFATAITPKIYRDLIKQVMHVHALFAAGSFDVFVTFFNEAGPNMAPFPASYDPTNFEIRRDGEQYVWQPKGKLAQTLIQVVDTLPTAKNDASGKAHVTGCPAFHAQGSASEASNKSAMIEFVSWIEEQLHQFYLPLFEDL